jgi:YHS domain-containing protein
MKKTLIVTLSALALVSLFILTACKGNGLGKGRVRMSMDENVIPGAVYAMQTYSSPQAKIGDNVVCPVLGTKFTVTAKSVYADIKGKRYYTCCAGCPEMLKSEPDKYLKK